MYMFDSNNTREVINPAGSKQPDTNGSSFCTPARNQGAKPQERVFKTPMTFSPRVVGEQAKPSPSRVQLWKEQLGLDDMTTDAMSDSDQSEDENEDKENFERNGHCSEIEFQALQKELDERNKQRDDLLFRIKSLTDKNKHYQQRIEKEETSKKQQIKIMRKTHETHLQEKENLIKNLEDIIEELEAKQSEENMSDGFEQASGVTKLVDQLSSLQGEKADISTQLLSSSSLVESLRGELDFVKKNYHALEGEKSKLGEELIVLKNTRGSRVHETEKELLKREQDIDRLHGELTSVKSKLITSNGHSDGNADTLKKLREENQTLKLQSQHVEAQLKAKCQSLEKVVTKLKDEVRMLTSDNQALSQEVRTLSAKVTALQARSPEIVTKIQKVEVENTGVQQEIIRTREQLAEAATKVTKLCDAVDEWKRKCDNANQHLHAAESRIQSLSVSASQSEKLAKDSVQFKELICDLESRLNNQSEERAAEVNKLKTLCDNNECIIARNKNDFKVMEEKIKSCEQELESYKNKMKQDIEKLISMKDREISAAKLDAEKQMRSLKQIADGLRQKLASTYPVLQALARDYVQLKKSCEEFPLIIKSTMEQGTAQLCQTLADISNYSQELLRKYRKEMKLRKKYHNELVELKGNIRVFCRLRPIIREDGAGGSAQIVSVADPDDDGLVNVTYKNRLQVFEVDRVFNAVSSQMEVFGEVQSLVISCVDGYNVCIFAYGQTGSGKTFTMEGPRSNPGINQRALHELFTETSGRSKEWNYSISVSCIEIYNESIRDLLGSNPTSKLDVKMNPGGGVHVPGLTQYEVTCVDDVNKVFHVGQENRSTAATNMNEHSSRSHALLCVEVVGTNTTTGARTLGKLNLVDLAGSERVSKSGADGARLKEAQSINKSLSCLGDVIHALRSKQPHVPYRNSRLTYLLQDSLGGDSKTLMIVQVSPVEKNVGESVASLNFAQRVRSVELGQASKRMENAEIAELKEKLSQYEDGSPGNTTNRPKISRRK